MEYPKRLYRGGKGITVNNIEEEQEFLGRPAEPIAPPVPKLIPVKKEEPVTYKKYTGTHKRKE